MSIDVLNETDADVEELELLACASYVMEQMRVHPQADLCIKLVDEDAMEVLHVQWMDLPGPTDVMAFPMDALPDAVPGPGSPPGPITPAVPSLLGDVVLCPAVAAEQPAGAGHSTESELSLLLTHGVLHLLGYDHGSAEEEQDMFELQSRLLRDWSAQTGRAPIRTPVAGTEGKVRSP